MMRLKKPVKTQSNGYVKIPKMKESTSDEYGGVPNLGSMMRAAHHNLDTATTEMDRVIDIVNNIFGDDGDESGSIKIESKSKIKKLKISKVNHYSTPPLLKSSRGKINLKNVMASAEHNLKRAFKDMRYVSSVASAVAQGDL